VSAARNRLVAAVRRLDRVLRSSPADQAEAWKQKVEWDALQTEIGNLEPKPAELERIADLFRADETGTERDEFVGVRQSLTGYATALRLSADDTLQEAYGKNLDELATRLESLTKETSSSDDLAMAGRVIGWLERAHQAPHVVAATRGRFHRPNAFAVASRKLIQAGFDDPDAQAKLNRPQAIHDNILGTTLHGTVYPDLKLSILLVPSEDRATLNMRLDGGASSSNVGYRGPVTVWTNGYTQIAASKFIYLESDGVTSSGTSASCSTSSNIDAISARCGLIEKVAWKQAGKQQGRAEAVASSRAESRIAGQVDSEVNDRLADANQSYLEKVYHRLVRRDSVPQVFQLSSTEEAVMVRLLHAGPDQLATPTDPPELTSTHDLAVRVHESAIMNFAEDLIGGETLTDERLVEILKENNRDVPEELQITPDKDPWSITFSPDQPVSAAFTGGNVRMAVRGRRFTRGDQVVRAEIEISANYKLEKTGMGSKLTREGDVSVEYVNRRQLSVREVAMKTFLRKKFDALFKPEISNDGLELPERFRSVGKLALRQLHADQGWLALGWEQMPAEPAKVAALGQ
jgi:hypothetical protein